MEIIVLTLGLLIGSFLNVCIYRIPTGGSIAFPASHCPNCKASLKPVDLIPVLSYMLQGGKCRYCGDRISAQYPIVEAANAVLYVFLYKKFGITIDLVAYCALTSAMIAMTVIDMRLQIIPDELNLFGLAAGIVFVVSRIGSGSAIDGIIGLLAGGGIFLAIAVVSGGNMGGGDIKLMGVLGLWFGWKLVLLITLLSFITGAIASVLLITLKIRGRKDFIPFGPFITISAWITMFKGHEILSWYISRIS